MSERQEKRREVLPRHLCLLGEMIQKKSEKPAAISKEALEAMVPKDVFPSIQDLLSFYLKREYYEEPFAEEEDRSMTESSALLASRMSFRVGGPSEYRMALAFLYVAANIFLLRGDENPVPAELRMDILKRAFETLKKDPAHLVLGAEPIIEWLTKCRQAFDEQEADKLSGAHLDTALVAEFREVFPREYANELRLLPFLVQNGFFECEHAAWFWGPRILPKKYFIRQADGGYGDIAYSEEARERAKGSDDSIVFLLRKVLLPAKDEPSEETKESHAKLAEERAFARRAMSDAAHWLSARGADGNQGLIIASPFPNPSWALADEPDWASKPRDLPSGGRDFAGRFRDYLVWADSFFRERCVFALDLRMSKFLAVDSRVITSNIWVDVPTLGTLDETEQGQLSGLQEGERADHFCKYVLRLYWKIDEKKLRNCAKLFPYYAEEAGGSSEPAA